MRAMWRWLDSALGSRRAGGGSQGAAGRSGGDQRRVRPVMTAAVPRIDTSQCSPWPSGGVLVGGAVRDLLLGLQPADLDWLVPEPAAAARRQAGDIGGSVFALDVERDHWRVVGPETTDGSERATHDFVKAPADPVADLWRRDLSINALAALPDGSILDPTGGWPDLRAGVVRMTSRASMAADAVKIGRASCR